MTEVEPGVDRHIWEAEYEGMDEALRTEPTEALPDFLDLVERMLVGHGYDTEPSTTDGAPEVRATLARARELVARTDAGEAVDNDDAFQATAELRALYRGLIEEPDGDVEEISRGA